MIRGASPASLARLVRTASARSGARRVLLLDLDGTLTDLQARPEHVVGLPTTAREALIRLHTSGWSIAVVTGRSHDDAERIVSIPGVTLFGSHGGEGPAGLTLDRSRRLRTRLERNGLAQSIVALARSFHGVQVEHKPLGLAVHDRGLSPGDRALWRVRLQRRLPRGDGFRLEVVRGKAVHELRPRGQHKGRVLDDWRPLRSLDETDRSVVALGDDRTDEDLFRALDRRGLRVRVGMTPQASLVDATLGAPVDVETFLAELCR